MGKRILTLAAVMLGLLGCSLAGEVTERALATETPAPEAIQPQETLTPAEVQDRLMEEWRPAHDRAAMLDPICSALWDTNWRFNEGEIDLERARIELAREAEFLAQARQIPDAAPPPMVAVAPYLNRLEGLASALDEVLASGDDALDAQVFDVIDETCNSLYNINLEIADAAQAEGLTTVSLNAMAAEIYPTVMEVYEIGEASVPGDEPAAVSGGQEELRAEWGPALDLGSVLLEVCTLMYQTHADFGQGVIDASRAQAELETESDFIGYMQSGMYSSAPQSDAVASHLTSLEEQMSALIEVYGVDDSLIGTAEVLAMLDPICGSLQERMQAIVGDAQAAGLSPESLDALDHAIRVEMIDDLYDLTIWGR